MRRISILVFEGAVGSAIVGSAEVLAAVNNYYLAMGKPLPFEIELVGYNSKNVDLGLGIQMNCSRTIKEPGDTDLILIPAFLIAPEQMLERYPELSCWLKREYEQGTELASLCLGAFFLAATGLLNEKICTTHWEGVETMRKLFPEVILKAELIITDQDGIYTGGGGFSSMNLILYLIEKFCGKETSVWAAKFFGIDLGRHSQTQFFIFNNQKRHGDDVIQKAQEYIEANYDGPIVVEDLAQRIGLSPRNFVRRFKKATQNTPIQYIQRVKIEAAKKELEMDIKTVNEVMLGIGYSDMKFFRELFVRITGISPTEYRSRYNRRGMEYLSNAILGDKNGVKTI